MKESRDTPHTRLVFHRILTNMPMLLLVVILLSAHSTYTVGSNESSSECSVSLASPSGEIVEIVRDLWSIPHIFAETSEGIFFGAGYAAAEDRMFQMDYSRRVVQGRISELIGQEGVESDKLWRLLGWYRFAQKVEKNLDLETRRLVEAYSAGVNQYLEQNSSTLLYLFSRYGIRPEPWTVADSIACWYRLSFLFGGINKQEVNLLHEFEQLVQQVGWEEAIAQMSPTMIVDETGATVQRADMDPLLIAEIEQYAEDHGYGSDRTTLYWSGDNVPKASHAWVVGGNRSTTGSAILHSDPQIQISAPSVWYEFHICGGDFNVRGIGIAGSPGVLIGWNRNIAWGVTALGPDSCDLFKLDINPTDSNQYSYDGIYRNMEVFEEEIAVRGGSNVNVTHRCTVLGPVVTAIIPGVRPGEEFALRHVETYNSEVCSLQALVRMMKAHDWESFQTATENYMAPGVHLLYGDSQGNIGYQMLAGIPLRSTRSPLGGVIAQYGNSSEFDWQELVPKRYLPNTFNPSEGAICSGNNLAVGSWYPLPLGLRGGGGDTTRSWRLRERLAMLQEFSQEEMLTIHRDMVNPAVREIVRLGNHIVYSLGQNLSTEATDTLDALVHWSGEFNTTESVYPLISNFWLYFRQSATSLVSIYGGGEGGLCYFTKTLKQRLDENGSYVPTSEESSYVDFILGNAWNSTVEKYGTEPSLWLENYDKTILILYQNNLESFGSLDPSKDIVSPDLLCKYTSTILSQHGNSYSQSVRFDDVDASRSVLPPGVSEDPNSSFFEDQISIWTLGELHEAPLSRGRIESIMTSYIVVEYWALQTDVDRDGTVNMLDVSYVARRFGVDVAHPSWSPYADINNDDRIDMKDVGAVARDFGAVI